MLPHSQALLILFCSMVLLTTSCNKSEPNCDVCEIFECKVNGVKWTPDCKPGPLFGCSAIDALYYNDTKALDLRVISVESNSRFRFSARNMKLGANQVYNGGGGEFEDYNLVGNCGRFDLDTTYHNYITILALDTVNYLVEGEFGFTAIAPCNDTVVVTEGKFLLGYRF